jgi:peptidoglycan/LPS O-acetylase OafA/YrhL
MTDRRLYMLDGLRGVAALVVVAGHVDMLLQPFHLGHYWLAVDLFFLMSGAVLGRTYEPRFARGFGARAFLLNRYVRLYPLYALGALVGIVGGAGTLMLGRGAFGPTGFLVAGLATLLLLPSPTWRESRDLLPFNQPGWSLLFELAANILFAVLRNRLAERRLIGLIGLSGAALAAGLVIHPGLSGPYWQGAGWGLPRIGFSFFLGVWMQRHHPGGRIRHPAVAWLLLAVTALLLGIDPPRPLLFDGLVLFLAWPAIVWIALGVDPSRPAPFAALGALSYPLYVLHLPVLGLAWRGLLFVHRDPASLSPWGGLLFLAAAAGGSLWLDRRVDAPVRRWLLRRLSPAPARDRRLEATDTPL